MRPTQIAGFFVRNECAGLQRTRGTDAYCAAMREVFFFGTAITRLQHGTAGERASLHFQALVYLRPRGLRKREAPNCDDLAAPARSHGPESRRHLRKCSGFGQSQSSRLISYSKAYPLPPWIWDAIIRIRPRPCAPPATSPCQLQYHSAGPNLSDAPQSTRVGGRPWSQPPSTPSYAGYAREFGN